MLGNFKFNHPVLNLLANEIICLFSKNCLKRILQPHMLLIHSNIKTNSTILKLVNKNLLFCTCVKHRQHMRV